MKIRNVINYLLLTLFTLVMIIALNYKVGNLGYLNLSDGIIMLFTGFYMNTSYIMLAFGVACSIADIVLGYGYLAGFTFIIKAIEVIVLGKLLKKNVNYSLSTVLVGLLVLILDCLVDCYLWGFGIILTSLKMHLLVVVIAVVASNFLTKCFRKG